MKVTNLIVKNQTYLWSGIDALGNKLTGEVISVSVKLAKLHLAKKNLTIFKIQKKNRWMDKTTYKKISPLDITIFFRQLATLIIAGVPIVQSCEILHQAQHNAEFQTIILALKADIEAGKELANSLRKFPRYFDELTCHLIQVGEQTGTFAPTLQRLALHKEKVLYFKNKLKQALFYPTIISIVAIIISIIMLTCIVPRFAELFQNMQGKLPAFTLGVIYLSHFIRNYSWLLGLPILTGVIFHNYFKNSARCKDNMDKILLKLPIFGLYLKKMTLANFSRSLANTFSAGVPIIDALKIIAHTSGNNTYTQVILELQIEIAKGQQLHRAMQKNVLFPNMLVQMIKIGEESGMLAFMLDKIVELYEKDIDHLVTNLSDLLEPLIMAILGVLIGGLVIAMYLPIFKLGTVF